MTDGLTFNTLRGGNLARLSHFKNRKGEFSHKKGLATWTIADWIVATVGELGEFANLYKKVTRGDLTFEEAKEELANELADVQTYLDLLAARCEINLGEATIKKFNEVSVRVGAPVELAADDWHYTKDQT